MNITSENVFKLTIGTLVYHPLYGEGTVCSINKVKIEVEFEHSISVNSITFKILNNIYAHERSIKELYSRPVEIVDSEELLHYKRRYNDFHNIQEENKDIT